MKTKSIVLITCVCALLLFSVPALINRGDKKAVNSVSAQNLVGKAFTPTPFATSVPKVIAQIMQKYARSEIITRTVHGVEMSAANFRVEDGILMADICFQKPSGEDWETLDVRARFENMEVGTYQTVTFDKVTTLQNGEQSQMTFFGNPPQVEIKNFPPASFPIDYRCGTEKMQIKPETTPTHIVLTVYNIDFAPNESQGCSYLDEIQSILDFKGTGIKLDCTKSKGYDRTSVREKPVNMSEAEAMFYIAESSHDVFWIKGPWVFEGEVMNLTDPAAMVEPVATEPPADVAPTP